MSSLDYDDDILRSEGTNKKAECIRNRTNFTIPKSYHMVDKKDFNPDMLNLYIDNDAAPKLKLLLEKIRLLDEQDMRLTGKLNKHLIFTDVNRSTYGVKIIASALTANGMNLVYHPQGKGFSMLDDSELRKTKNNNYAALLSKSFFDRPVNTKIRKAVLEKFNSRPDNTYGELIRFIILDQGFKEGIDLFDVKYVHLFEPLAVNADEKQAIGRATRFCGQKGLEFHPRYGWSLYVFKYDVVIPKILQNKYMDSETLFELYIKNSNLDMRKIIFANELENATIGASVDKELNKPIHQFAIEKPANILKSQSKSGGSSTGSSRGGGGAVGKPKSTKATPPAKIMNLEKMQEYIKKNFGAFKYPALVLENKCVSGVGGGANGNIVSFTPTQDFVRHYFQPQSAYKGILLHHSVGTGKTCTAIATATTSFDVENYTILWVTRHTLKADIWKNMFGQVCSIDIQDKIKKGLVMPNKITSKSKYISANWMEPISYKQFSNMLFKKNKIYAEMVKRNGTEDPLHKTLLIIDEAHKLYSPTVAKSERPNTRKLEEMIQKSYEKSGADSVRVMLMTATPFTEDGMEMIKLLNLLREDDKIEADFGNFSDTYLDAGGYFTKVGLRQFQDKVSGYISYLNRSQDARNFAHPVIKNVFAKMSLEKGEEHSSSGSSGAKLNMSKADMDNIKEIKSELKELLKQEKALDIHEKELKACIKIAATNYKAATKNILSLRKEGEKKCKAELKVLKDKNKAKACNDKVLDEYNGMLNRIDDDNNMVLLRCADKNRQVKSNSNVKRMLERKKELEADVAKYNKAQARIKENKDKNKDKREDIKVFTTKKNNLKDKIRTLRDTIVDLEEKYIAALNKAEEIVDKADRKKALTELKMSSAYSLAKKELKELRAQASKLNTQQQLMKVSYGFKKITKISQQYAIDKYCV